jgi:hypothetical protein
VTSGSPPGIGAVPGIGETIAGAFRDALPLMRSRQTVYAVLAVLCALGGLGVPLVHGFGVNRSGQNMDFMVRLQLAFQAPNLIGALAAIFVVLPTVARTANPAFRLTPGKFFGMIGVAIVVGVASQVGFILLIVPGVYVAVKLSQSVWAFLLSEGKNPWGESWAITIGSFWTTFGFAIALGFATIVPLLGYFCAAVLAIAVPLLAFVLLPVAFLCYVYTYHVALLGQMRWMVALRASAIRV